MFRTLTLFFFLLVHPVHVSLISVEYDRSAELFRVFVKVFFDDFLVDAGIVDANEVMNKDLANFQIPDKELTEEYFTGKLVISVNEKQVNGRITATALSDGELNVNMLFDAGHAINTVTVKSFIMTDIFDDQANMVILKVNDFEEGVKLTPERTGKTFNIK